MLVLFGAPVLLIATLLAVLGVSVLAAHEYPAGTPVTASVLVDVGGLALFGFPLGIAGVLVGLGVRSLRASAWLRGIQALLGARTEASVEELSAALARPGSDVVALLQLSGVASPVGSAAPRAAPALPGSIQADRVAAVRRGMLTRGVLALVAAVPLGAAGLVFGAAMLVVGREVLVEQGVGVAVLAVVTLAVIPLAVAGLLTWRGYANLRDRTRVQVMASALSSGSVRSFGDLGHALDLPSKGAERFLTTAVSRGLVSPAALASLSGDPRIGLGVEPALARSVDEPGGWLGRLVQGRYRVEARLGHGGMGAVFRARDERNGAPCALKVLPRDADAPAALHRFAREATLVRGLHHPGLLRLFDFGDEAGAPFLVMELLEGDTLEQRLAQRGSLRWDEALHVARSVGGALALLHAAGLVHRDVKPANIVLAAAPAGERPVLIDFGLAKRVDAPAAPRVTSTGAAVGTPLYMSPEQARGEPLDPRSDLFGLAVVVYEMVTGVPPFFDKTLAEVYARLLQGTAAPASQLAPCSPALDAALARALASRREDRFPDVASFVAALEKCV